MNHFTLVIDQGGQSTRALVFSAEGQLVAAQEAPIGEAHIDQNQFIEYEAETILDACRELMADLAKNLSKQQLQNLKSAAFISQRSSIIACTRQGEALGNMISWQDTRNADWLEQQQWNSELLQAQTGLRPNAHMGASKIRYLLDKDPVIQQAVKENQVIFMPWGAWLLQQLCNYDFRCQCDPILASRMGLVELAQAKWSVDLLERYGIPLSTLPEIVPSINTHGYLYLENKAIPLMLLGGDQNFIPYAYGESAREQCIFINIGTGAFIQSLKNEAQAPTLLCSPIAVNTGSGFISQDNSELVLEGTINAAANSLLWWQEQLTQPYSHEELDRILKENYDTAAAIPIFINTRWGSGSPYWITKAHCTFIKCSEHHTDKQKTRAVLESIIFACKVNVDILQKVSPARKYAIISGGLSRSNALCQTLANLTGMAIHRYEDQEASARGAAFYLNEKIHQYAKQYLLEEPSIFKPKINPNTDAQLKRFQIYKTNMESLSLGKGLIDS